LKYTVNIEQDMSNTFCWLVYRNKNVVHNIACVKWNIFLDFANEMFLLVKF